MSGVNVRAITSVLWCLARRFCRDSRGATIIYVAFAGSLAMAGGVVALDFGRVVVLKSQMQNAADAAALSGATQLDGLSGAISRATRIARDAVRHGSALADGGGSFTVDSLVFYSELEPTPVTTTSDDEAVFMKVTLSPQRITVILQPFVDLISTGTRATSMLDLQAEATAGLSPIICEAPPFMACNPAEVNGSSDDLLDPNNAGRQLLTKEGNGGGGLAPGNFGLLCPPTGSCGASAVGDALASDPGQCYSTLITTSPGVQTQQARNGINARMDEGTKNPKRPAQNIKGYPRDSNMTPSRVIGNGNWNPNSYWNTEHSGETAPAGVSTYTRYQMYLYELGETFYRNGKKTIYPASGSPPAGYSTVSPAAASIPPGGTPTSTPSTDIKRRVMKVAVLDCNALNVRGSGSYPTYGRYIEVFLTESVSAPSSKANVYGEIVGPLDGTNTDSYHVNVKLYD